MIVDFAFLLALAASAFLLRSDCTLVSEVCVEKSARKYGDQHVSFAVSQLTSQRGLKSLLDGQVETVLFPPSAVCVPDRRENLGGIRESVLACKGLSDSLVRCHNLFCCARCPELQSAIQCVTETQVLLRELKLHHNIPQDRF